MASPVSADAIQPGETITLDGSAVLAYLDGTERVSKAAAIVMDELVATGRNSAMVSTITVTEVLVRPFRAASASGVGTAEAFLRRFPHLVVQPVTYEIAREAARIRASTALRAPDAVILATASVMRCPVVVANDARWRSAIERAGIPVRLFDLDAVASSDVQGPG